MNEDFMWVSKVIASCENEDHLGYIPAILELFEKKHNDWSATRDLMFQYQEKVSTITKVIG
jgi:hypothetical protein